MDKGELHAKVMKLSAAVAAGVKVGMKDAFIGDDDSFDIDVDHMPLLARAMGVGMAEGLLFIIGQLRVPLDNGTDARLPHSMTMSYYFEAMDAVMSHLCSVAAKQENLPISALTVARVHWNGGRDFLNYITNSMQHHENQIETEKALEQKKQAGGRVQTH